MDTIRIIGGDLKGRVIPFSNSRYDNAEITPQKVKEAVFSIIGGGFPGKSFLDLFGGSGQVGFEALSRGASPVVINECEKKRYAFIRSFAQALSRGEELLTLNLHWAGAMKYLRKRGFVFDYIFIDQPYVKVKGEAERYNMLLDGVEKGMLLRKGGSVIIQHFSGNVLAEMRGGFALADRRTYGSTSLSFYAAAGRDEGDPGI